MGSDGSGRGVLDVLFGIFMEELRQTKKMGGQAEHDIIAVL
jgi:hypothetical protein